MTLHIKGEGIDLEVPAYFKQGNNFSMITAENVITVFRDNAIVVYNRSENVFTSQVGMIVKRQKSTSVEFLEMLFEAQKAINEAAGLSEIPTIFSQTKKGNK